jgi:hypothetical protein
MRACGILLFLFACGGTGGTPPASPAPDEAAPAATSKLGPVEPFVAGGSESEILPIPGSPGPPAGPFHIRQGRTQVSGRLPWEVVRRIVRKSYGDLRTCYEAGLVKSPSLKGHLTMKLVIDIAPGPPAELRSGVLTEAVKTDSDLPDAAMVDCVVGVFRRMEFPEPESGSVTVLFPLSFAPGP